MTSLFARNQRLEQSTLDAYARFTARPHDLEAKVKNFCMYLQNIVPQGISVRHEPVRVDAAEPTLERNPVREEILLENEKGKIFMSGLVSLEVGPVGLERAAGDEAYTSWLNGDFAPDGDKWRFFIGHGKTIKFFRSDGKDGWVAAAERFRLNQNVDEAAAFLQQEFDKIPT